MAEEKNKNKKGVNPLVAAAAGAAIGAAAVALSDKKTRDKIKNKTLEGREKGGAAMEEAKKRAKEAKDKGKEKLVEGLEKAKNKLEEPET